MDRGDLSEAIIQEVSAIVAEESRVAGPELLTADLDGMEARLQQLSRRVCGSTLERVLAVRAIPQGERPPCPACGGLLRLVDGARGRDLQGLTGDATLVRPTCVYAGWLWAGPCAPGRGVGAGRGDAAAPIGARGVPGGHHRGLQRGGDTPGGGPRRRGGRRDGAPRHRGGRRGGRGRAAGGH